MKMSWISKMGYLVNYFFPNITRYKICIRLTVQCSILFYRADGDSLQGIIEGKIVNKIRKMYHGWILWNLMDCRAVKLRI